MRILKIFHLIFILILLSACNNSEFLDKEVPTKAKRITDKLSEKNIDIFRTWQFEYQGKGELWTKYKKNRIDYLAYYLNETDSTSFMVFSWYLKSSEYSCLIEIDTSKYLSNIWFIKSKDGKIKIRATEKNGTEVIIGENYSDKDVFGENSPFTDLLKLSSLKDELEVLSISHDQNFGEFIQFYITYEDVLTYIPNELNLNPKYENIWLDKFKSGKMIKKNWNLRHLNKPK